jgi:hypothetical protein
MSPPVGTLIKGASNNLLRGRMAALRGARRLAYLHDMSRLLRSGRLALQPLATAVRGALVLAIDTDRKFVAVAAFAVFLGSGRIEIVLTAL